MILGTVPKVIAPQKKFKKNKKILEKKSQLWFNYPITIDKNLGEKNERIIK